MRAAIVSLVAILCACGPGTDRGNGGTGGDAGGSGSGGDGGGSGSGGGDTIYVYAHTAATLYRVNPDTLAIQKVADFQWPGLADQMTDIAIDKNGVMIGISFTAVYKVDPGNAKATLLSNNLQGMFNGLSFVPADQLGMTGDDILVGTRNTDGKVFKIDPMTGAATQVGDMGAYKSSGDLVAVAGFGTVQTVSGTHDVLARLAPQTFSASLIGTSTGFDHIWGVAFFKNKIYGFTDTGQFVLIDPTTGAATMVSQQPGVAWWGAAVTTLAPVLQ